MQKTATTAEEKTEVPRTSEEERIGVAKKSGCLTAGIISVGVFFFTIAGIALLVISYFIGVHYGENDYMNSLIAVKYVDGRYGTAFYGVEVTGQEEGDRVAVYAKIYVHALSDGQTHDCGRIGTAKSWPEARKQFGDIQWDGKGISIGPYRIERKQYENHR